MHKTRGRESGKLGWGWHIPKGPSLDSKGPSLSASSSAHPYILALVGLWISSLFLALTHSDTYGFDFSLIAQYPDLSFCSALSPEHQTYISIYLICDLFFIFC